MISSGSSFFSKGLKIPSCSLPEWPLDAWRALVIAESVLLTMEVALASNAVPAAVNSTERELRANNR